MPQITIRLESELLEQADRLAEQFARTMPGLEVTRASVLRTAIIRGLEVLQNEHGGKSKPKKR